MGLRKALFALVYDRQMAKVEKAGLGDLRHRVVGRAHGDVLEIGAGTGTNLSHYGTGVGALTMTEPERSMLKRLQSRALRDPLAPLVLRAPAEDLPFDDGSFDVVVSTLVLCGVTDQQRALREIHRVLRPGGELLFIEHVRSDDAKLARLQNRMNGVNRFLVGCECNRSTLRSIETGGYQVTDLDRSTMPEVPPFLRPLIVGAARTIPDERFSTARSTDEQTPERSGTP